MGTLVNISSTYKSLLMKQPTMDPMGMIVLSSLSSVIARSIRNCGGFWNSTCFLFGCPKLAPKYNKFFSETIVETINGLLFFIVYRVFFLDPWWWFPGSVGPWIPGQWSTSPYRFKLVRLWRPHTPPGPPKVSRWWQLKYISFIFTPNHGEKMYIFSRRWFNHQLVIVWPGFSRDSHVVTVYRKKLLQVWCYLHFYSASIPDSCDVGTLAKAKPFPKVPWSIQNFLISLWYVCVNTHFWSTYGIFTYIWLIFYWQR